MAINFPNSPNTNDTFTAGSITYKWDGAKWIGLGLTPVDRIVEGSNSLIITSNDLLWSGGKVGINSSSPSTTLSVGGTVTATTFSGDGSALTGITAGFFEKTDVGINTTSNVGIATTSPRTSLHVKGPVHTDRFFQNPTSLDTSITFPESGGAVNGGVFGPYTIESGVTLTIASGSIFKVI